MKFLVDAQLPVKLAQILRQKGYDAIHTKELPHQNQTSDPGGATRVGKSPV